MVMSSAGRGTMPSPAVYDVVKICTTAGAARRAVASSELLRSAAVVVAAARGRV